MHKGAKPSMAFEPCRACALKVLERRLHGSDAGIQALSILLDPLDPVALAAFQQISGEPGYHQSLLGQQQGRRMLGLTAMLNHTYLLFQKSEYIMNV